MTYRFNNETLSDAVLDYLNGSREEVVEKYGPIGGWDTSAVTNMSQLFGGFNDIFYSAYENAFPLEPGWQERLDIYQLYYLLAHLNMFGLSYLGSVMKIVKAYQ